MPDKESFDIDEIMQAARRSEMGTIMRSGAVGLLIAAAAIAYGPVSAIITGAGVMAVIIAASARKDALQKLRG